MLSELVNISIQQSGPGDSRSGEQVLSDLGLWPTSCDRVHRVTVDLRLMVVSVVPTLLIGMSEPFVGLAHPGVSGVAFSGLP
ncbi:hypothetical protein, partial [Streptomyces sp. NPDC055681]